MHSIKLKSIGHHFRNNQQTISLFSDLNLSVVSAKSYAIVGASGVGKSSLLSLIAGLEKPCSGAVEVKIANQYASDMVLRRQSGFIFQQFHLLPELDALGNIALPLKLKGDREAINKAMNCLEKVGLKDRASHKPNQLSGGEQQRVAIARAFVSQPAFIFADEPTGNLDESTAQRVTDLLFDFTREHQSSLVLVTHSEQLAARADYVYRLSHGSLQLEQGVLIDE